MKILSFTLLFILSAYALGGQASIEEENKWSRAGFKNPKFYQMSEQELAVENAKFTHALNLSAVILRGSGWTIPYIVLRVKKIANIYAQCGLKIQSVKIVEADSPVGKVDLSYVSSAKIANLTPRISRPTLYFFRGSKEGEVAYAWTKRDIAPGTAWITGHVVAEYSKHYHPSYNTEAHELGHILTDSNHLEDGSNNLMAGDYKLLNGNLNAQQCSHFLSSQHVRPL